MPPLQNFVIIGFFFVFLLLFVCYHPTLFLAMKKGEEEEKILPICTAKTTLSGVTRVGLCRSACFFSFFLILCLDMLVRDDDVYPPFFIFISFFSPYYYNNINVMCDCVCVSWRSR